MGAALRALDAVVGEDAERSIQLRRSALDRPGGCADGQNGFTQLGNGGIGGGCRLGHLIHHGVRFAGFHPQRGHGVRHHVRCRCQVNAASCCKIQHGGQRIIDFLGIVTSQRQVVHGIRALAGGEGRFRTHLLGKIPECFHRIDRLTVQFGHGVLGDAHGGLHLAHGGIEVRCGLDRCRTKPCHSGSHREQLLTGTGNLIPGGLQLISYLFNPGKSGIGLDGLFLQAFQLLLSFDDLPLEGIVFVLPQVAAFQLCFGLLLGQLQRIQFFLGGADGVLEQLLLLGQQFRIGGVQPQQLGYILQTGLGGLDGRVDAFQRLVQSCGIAADLNGNALDSACQIASPPENGIKIARISPSMKRAPGVSRCSIIDIQFCKLEFVYSFVSL